MPRGGDAAAAPDLSGIRSDGYATLPPENSLIQPGPGVGGPGPGVLGGPPMPPVPPGQPSGPWSPPGIETPWPKSEYIRDGGHVGAPLTVNRQGQVRGLQMEDTVAQYETLDGQSHVQPSNPVYLYAPRFGAVRQVANLEDGVQIDRLRGLHEPVKLSAPTINTPVTTGHQDLQVGDDIGMQPASIFHAKQGYGAVSIAVGPRSFQDRYKAFENYSIIRLGAIRESESAWVARGSDAAAVWTDKQAVQILLEHRAAVVDSVVEKLGTVYTNDLPPTPRLRIVKLASTSDAKPGETVDFTLRFDNLGLQAIGSVVILDSLSARLAYVPSSAQCSLDARFSTQANEGESLVMRCELLNPLKPGQGGVIRFQCRVR